MTKPKDTTENSDAKLCSSSKEHRNEQPRCESCGQLLVSGDADGSKRRNKRSKSGGAAGDKPDGLSRSQGSSDQDGIGVGSCINVAFAFSGGDYAGQARVVRVDPGGLCIAFPWSGSEKLIQISRSEVVND